MSIAEENKYPFAVELEQNEEIGIVLNEGLSAWNLMVYCVRVGLYWFVQNWEKVTWDLSKK